MNFLTIAFTRVQRIKPPSRIPDVTRAEAQSWFSGWWHGIAAGSVIGFGLAVLIVGAV